jgi:hypothetical protein
MAKRAQHRKGPRHGAANAEASLQPFLTPAPARKAMLSLCDPVQLAIPVPMGYVVPLILTGGALPHEWPLP